MCRVSLLAVASVVSWASARAAWSDGPRVVMEEDLASMGSAPTWRHSSRASPSELVHPIFMLRHEPGALASFEGLFWDISTPGRTGYGAHLSRAAADALLPPQAGAREAVLAFLKEHGVQPSSESADMIEAEMTAEVAERMFQTEMHLYQHQSSGAFVVRASSPYTVPAAVAQHLYLVGDLVQMPAVGSLRSVEVGATKEAAAGWPQDCESCSGLNYVTPAVLQQAYKLGEGPSAVNTTMAVAEFQGVSWDTGDLVSFTDKCKLTAPVKVDRQVGTNLPICKVPLMGSQCIEALLDIEYIKAVGGKIPLTVISALRFSLINFAQQVATMEDAPLVLSISYGSDEIQQTSRAFMNAVNVQFMKLGARGISVLVASGDQGVYGRTGPSFWGGIDTFHPDFPASSPYVTAVGGTDFAKESVIGAEMAWSQGGGGFSNTFPMPAYQAASVASYLAAAKAKGVLPNSSFNSTGRAYPDLAALGGQQNPYCVAASMFVVSSMTGVAGTSASCPVVAGIFARLNALRASKSLPPMGFLNPFIYMNAGAFNDVTLGVNHGDGTHGFRALPGWDPATGVGTPDFEKLEVAAMKVVALIEQTLVV